MSTMCVAFLGPHSDNRINVSIFVIRQKRVSRAHTAGAERGVGGNAPSPEVCSWTGRRLARRPRSGRCSRCGSCCDDPVLTVLCAGKWCRRPVGNHLLGVGTSKHMVSLWSMRVTMVQVALHSQVRTFRPPGWGARAGRGWGQGRTAAVLGSRGGGHGQPAGWSWRPPRQSSSSSVAMRKSAPTKAEPRREAEICGSARKTKRDAKTKSYYYT